MLTVRVFFTDFASDVVARLAYELGYADHFSVFGRACHFLSQVAHRRPNGVLDGLTAAQLATMAGWTGVADVFLEAALRSGFLCRPSVDPHHHKRCTARAPGRDGEPERQHPPAELAVHQWDQRMGRCYREFLRGSRPGRVSILLRPPPRGARVGYGPAPQGAGGGARLADGDAPRGVSPESAAPQGDPVSDPQGGDGPPMEPPPNWRGNGKRPAGRSHGVRGSAPRGNPQGASLTKPSAPRGVKRRPSPHPRPGKDKTTSCLTPTGAAAAPQAGQAGGGASPSSLPASNPAAWLAWARGQERPAGASPGKKTPRDFALKALAEMHFEDGRLLVPAAKLRDAFLKTLECPTGKHRGNHCVRFATDVELLAIEENEKTRKAAGRAGPAAVKGGAA